MVITIKREAFDTFDDVTLGWTCIEPAMQRLLQERSEQLQAGEGVGIQSHLYTELTHGQQALLMFWVVYNHLKKESNQFYWWVAYFLSQPRVWGAFTSGIRHFGDDEMLQLIEELERKYEEKQVLASWPNVSAGDLDMDQALREEVIRLHAAFQERAAVTMRTIAQTIRQHPDRFVQIEE